MSLVGYERETIINYNEVEKEASIYTCNAALKRKLQKYLDEHPGDIKKLKEDEDSVEYMVPKKWIKVTPPRQMSEEAKLAAKERLQEYWDNVKASE